ncbi:uncharacterized protein LOC127536113 isoform X1 [Acanthochromis polyacanthus]|uniref:uncharacterized protein LOC127536113 isoform X1 n=1 Tax=Acanthochromis polyacanthus TaxID=80966 RepID=UPI002233E7CD|nr:uncharacterized protein LOC127536113 isoform X1 [Acanthochromis polyacanthus]
MSLTDDDLELVVSVARNSSGGSRLRLGNVPYDEILSKKERHLYNPENDGSQNNLCFSLCLAHFVNKTLSPADKMKYAKQLHNAVGFYETHKVSLSDITKFENHLNIKIVVFHHSPGRKNLQCYKTHDAAHATTVWMYLHNEHYYLILNKCGFFGGAYVCDYCYASYAEAFKHVCKYLCNVCYTQCHMHRGASVKCADCKRICNSIQCYNQHKHAHSKHGAPPCDKVKYCEECGKTYNVRRNQHKCTLPKCTHCGETLNDSDVAHDCFIQPLKKPTLHTKYIFFDFETRYHEGKHEANYVCAMDTEGNKFCFNTVKCVDAFVKQYRQPKYKGYTFIAHNASGFDNYILLEYFVQQGIPPTVTMRGSRVILMYDKAFQQRWIDSFSFLPMRLSRTPAAMGFEDLEKGYFPHKFNTPPNEYYVGKYPDPSYYGYDSMSDSDKQRFMAWYDSVREKTFDFQTEIQHYCSNDVEVLRKACLIYRETFISCTDLDPFAFTTLPSSCMGVFKTRFLPKDTLVLTYEGAYTRQNKTYSDVSMQWLEFMAKAEGSEIRHALNHGEQRFGDFIVDGYNRATNTCYEFAGCFFHGCVRCHVQTEVNPVTKKTYGSQYHSFCEKISTLKSVHGVRVVVMWECEWEALKLSDPSVQAHLITYKPKERLDPRQALFGGRTNAIKLYHETDNTDEKIGYYDFTSLYPTVQAKKQYPVGHPQIIHRDFAPLENYFGFVKCTVLPPRGLYHPVLPYRCHKRLMFPLCGRCAEELNQTTACLHTDAERRLSGVWVSFELQKAVQKGYQIVCIDEVWHFPNKTDTLFTEYVKTFLKCKQEASGYPRHVITPAEKAQYIQDYHEKEGILLDADKICVNKAVRNCNKLLLNSLWGRFSMRSNMPSCELITEPERFTQLMFSDQYDVRQFGFISDDVAIVQWRHADGRASRVSDVNVFIGAMTTAYARLMLYDLLDRLQERVLYCDTDSVIFTSGPGDWVPPLGPYLGDLTDEINDGDVCGLPEEDFITEFVSGGPKCYAYCTKRGKTQVKCKGVTLNVKNAAVVTHESLKGLVQSFLTNQNQQQQHVITEVETVRRDKKKFHLKNDTVHKKVKVVYNKRRVMPDYTTLPYGY